MEKDPVKDQIAFQLVVATYWQHLVITSWNKYI